MPMLTRKYRKIFGLYFTEVTIIFLGITFSFLFEQWRQDRAQQQLQLETLSLFANDIKQKIDEAGRDSTDFREMKLSLDTLLMVGENKLNLDLTIEKRRVGFYLAMNVGSIHYFQWNTATFQNVLSNGNIKSIKNDSLAQAILQFYQGTLYGVHLSYDRLSHFKFDLMQPKMLQLGSVFNTQQDTYFPDYSQMVRDKSLLLFVSQLRNLYSSCMFSDHNVRKKGFEMLAVIEAEKKRLSKTNFMGL